MRGYRGSLILCRLKHPSCAGRSKSRFKFGMRGIFTKSLSWRRRSGTQLVFMASPYFLSEEEQMRFNKTAEIAAQENIRCWIIIGWRDEIGLDYAVIFGSDHVK